MEIPSSGRRVDRRTMHSAITNYGPKRSSRLGAIAMFRIIAPDPKHGYDDSWRLTKWRQA